MTGAVMRKDVCARCNGSGLVPGAYGLVSACPHCSEERQKVARALIEHKKSLAFQENRPLEQYRNLDADILVCKSFSLATKRRVQFRREVDQACVRLRAEIARLEAMLRDEIPMEAPFELPF